jgi:isochorismate synthase
LPKQEAFQFILDYEHHQRSYYSGFLGPLFVNGQTNLYVTLRCMQLFENGYRLYAGGGLLKDSVEELEWQETETKLDTMRRILKTE